MSNRELTTRMDDLVDRISALPILSSLQLTLEEAAEAVATNDVVISRSKKEQLLTALIGDADEVESVVSALMSKGLVKTVTRSTPGDIQRRLNADAHERMRLEAAAIGGVERNNGIVVSIVIPAPYAHRWPDLVVNNRGHPPHITSLYIASEMNNAGMSSVLHRVRAAARTIPPFRVFVDAQSGLQDFGDTDSGEKALWLSARAEPRGELGRLHRTLKMALEREGIKIESHKDYKPHTTWAYVPNDFDDDDRRKMDARISDRFASGFWFDVRHIHLSMPDGGVKVIALSPVPRRSVY